MKILHQLAWRKIRNMIKNSNRQKAFPVLSKARKVLVLSTNNDSEIRSLIVGLKKDGKRVDVWAYGKQSHYLKDKTQFKRFGNQDVTLLGLPKQYIINNIGNEEYDIVIDLTLEDILPLQYLLAVLNSPFKVGLKKQFADNYDFMIEKNDDFSEKELLSQIIFYLTQIEPKT